MIQIEKKEKCCGCTACYSVCPQKAIEMKADEEGFKYPQVHREKCINCGLCDKVCPITNKQIPDTDQPLKAYVVRNKKESTLLNSASGGFFSALAEYVISKNGYVFGAVYGEHMRVYHWGTHTLDGITRFRSSKYVQSDLENVFLEVKNLLDLGRLVCFSGTPCQIEGLKWFLRKDYNNLITVDLICHGVPSPMLWDKYIETQKERYKSEIVEINFRNKDYGYHNSTLKINFENGRIHHGSSRNDAMMKCFFGEIASRPSCYSCPFKYARHESDFTIFDAWHGAQLVGRPDDEKGYTHLFVQTEKGLNILENLNKRIEMAEVDPEKAIEWDGPMVRRSAKPHKNRYCFLKEVNVYGIDKAVEKYIPISKKDVLLVSTKGILYKLGILKMLQRFAKKLHI